MDSYFLVVCFSVVFWWSVIGFCGAVTFFIFNEAFDVNDGLTAMQRKIFVLIAIPAITPFYLLYKLFVFAVLRLVIGIDALITKQ